MKVRPMKKINSVDGTEVEYWEIEDEISSIHEELESESEADQLKQLKKFPLRPSAANKLDLDLYLELDNWHAANNGLPIPHPVGALEGRVLSLLQLGHTIEPQVISHVEKLYKVEHRNKTVKYGEIKTKDGDTIELRGELDMALLDEETGRRMIGDSKTSGRFAFNLTPKAEHFAQINLYLHSEEMKSLGYTQGRIYYYNKDNSEMKAFGFKYSPKLAQAVLDKFQRIYTSWESGERVEQTAFWGGDDWRADYSGFKHELHEKFKVAPSQRIQTTDSELFNELSLLVKTKGQKKAINEIGTRIGDNVILDKSGKNKLYLHLTYKGLVVIIDKNDGFEAL